MKIRFVALSRTALAAAVIAAFGLNATDALAKKSTDKLNVAIVAVNYNSPTIQEMSDVAMADCKKNAVGTASFTTVKAIKLRRITRRRILLTASSMQSSTSPPIIIKWAR